MTTVFGKSRRRRPTLFTQRIQSLESGPPRFPPGLGVQIGGGRSQFQHVAQHQPFTARFGSHRRQRRRQRGGIGVVGIVNHRAAMSPAQALQPTADSLQTFQPLPNLRQRRAGRQRRCACRQRIADVMPTGQRQCDFNLALRRLQQKPVADRIKHLAVDRGRLIQSKADNATPRIQCGPVVGVFIIAVDDRDAVWPQALENFALSPRHSRHIAETFQMTGASVIDDRDIGSRQSG